MSVSECLHPSEKHDGGSVMISGSGQNLKNDERRKVQSEFDPSCNTI